MLRSKPLLLLVCVFTAPALLDAASPDPKSLIVPTEELSKARELVRQLGNDEFAVRERAEAELAKMGRAARAALLESVNTDPSQEVRSRCMTLLPRATSLDMKARLEVFLADEAGEYEHDLPGWNQLLAAVRGEWSLLGVRLAADRSLDKPARAVFAELLSTPINRQLVVGLGTSTDAELGAWAANRRQELYNQKYGRVMLPNGGIRVNASARREPTLEDIATLLFVESQVPSKTAPRTTSITVLLTSSGFLTAARETTEKSRVYRAIASAWLDSRQDPLDMYYGTTVASQLGLTESGIRLAARLLGTKGAAISYRGNAAATLARLGNKSHIPLLAKALEDNSVLTTLRRNVVKDGKVEISTTEIQLRDVALAVSIVLAGEKPEDYGFVDQFGGGTPAGAAFSYTRYYLPDGQRDAALAQWKKAREKVIDEKK